jgi:NAD-dependent SIR2 family protein deacetylase
MAEKMFRCRKCREFFKAERTAVAECEGCDFRTARCNRCGGTEGALASMRAHVRWFFHFGRYHSEKTVVVPPHLKILSGGKTAGVKFLRRAAR